MHSAQQQLHCIALAEMSDADSSSSRDLSAESLRELVDELSQASPVFFSLWNSTAASAS